MGRRSGTTKKQKRTTHEKQAPSVEIAAGAAAAVASGRHGGRGAAGGVPRSADGHALTVPAVSGVSAEAVTAVADGARDAVIREHLRFGWWLLLAFLTLGIALEAMHALKLSIYLDVTNETRRLMWTLGHAHGTLLAIVNIAFAVSLPHVPGLRGRAATWASRLLLAATVLMPLGFLLGGTVVRGGDPNAAIALVPVGAAALLVGVLIVAWSVGRSRAEAT